MQTRFYVAYEAKGDKFNCASCRETKCLLKGAVEIDAYWPDPEKPTRRERITINNEKELFAYIDRGMEYGAREGIPLTEFDLVYAGSGHRICPIPLFDNYTLTLMQFVDLSGEVSPLEVPRLPAYYVAIKSVIDSERMRMERKYVPRHNNPNG